MTAYRTKKLKQHISEKKKKKIKEEENGRNKDNVEIVLDHSNNVIISS